MNSAKYIRTLPTSREPFAVSTKIVAKIDYLLAVFVEGTELVNFSPFDLNRVNSYPPQNRNFSRTAFQPEVQSPKGKTSAQLFCNRIRTEQNARDSMAFFEADVSFSMRHVDVEASLQTAKRRQESKGKHDAWRSVRIVLPLGIDEFNQMKAEFVAVSQQLIMSYISDVPLRIKGVTDPLADTRQRQDIRKDLLQVTAK